MTKEEFAFIGCRLIALFLAFKYSSQLIGSIWVLVAYDGLEFPTEHNVHFFIQVGHVLAPLFLWKYAKNVARLMLR